MSKRRGARARSVGSVVEQDMWPRFVPLTRLYVQHWKLRKMGLRVAPRIRRKKKEKLKESVANALYASRNILSTNPKRRYTGPQTGSIDVMHGRISL